MLRKMYKFICLTWVLLASCVVYSVEIHPSNKTSYEFYGRVLFNDQGQAYLSWPGSSIEARFTGSKLALHLRDDTGQNYYNVIIDGQHKQPHVLATRKGEHRYLISDSLANTEHRVEVYKRTEGVEKGTWFIGLETAEKGELLTPPSRPKRKIAFFGDSITSGMGNEAELHEDDEDVADKNNYLAYGAITARMLEAEHQTVSLSGIGIMVSWFDFIMPNYFDQHTAIGDNDTRWDFSQWQADVVVINLMQNDSWLIDNERRLQPEPSRDDIVSAYQTFVQRIRVLYPDAYVVCVLGSMDASRKDSPWPSYIAKAVKRIKDGDKKARIDTLLFEFDGFYKHPRVMHHQRNAKKLSEFIQSKMQW